MRVVTFEALLKDSYSQGYVVVLELEWIRGVVTSEKQGWGVFTSFSR